MLDPEDTAAKGLFFFGGIEGCRFRKPVVPGDTLVGVGGRCVGRSVDISVDRDVNDWRDTVLPRWHRGLPLPQARSAR